MSQYAESELAIPSMTEPPLYIDRDDPLFLLLLLFAAHPDLRPNYRAMVDASRRVPDPRMWAALIEVERRVEPLRHLGHVLRELPSPSDFDQELNVPDVRRSMSQQEWLRAKEMRAWHRFIHLQHSSSARAPTPFETASSRPNNDDLTLTRLSSGEPQYHNDGDTSTVVDEDSEEEEPPVVEGGVWLEQYLSIAERAAAEEERRIERRLARQQRRAQRDARNTHNESESAQTGQTFGRTAEQAVVNNGGDPGSGRSIDRAPEESHELLFARLSLDGNA